MTSTERKEALILISSLLSIPLIKQEITYFTEIYGDTVIIPYKPINSIIEVRKNGEIYTDYEIYNGNNLVLNNYSPGEVKKYYSGLTQINRRDRLSIELSVGYDYEIEDTTLDSILESLMGLLEEMGYESYSVDNVDYTRATTNPQFNSLLSFFT